MKGDPEDLKDLATELDGVIDRHSDACRNNPDLETDLIKLRDNVRRRYTDVTEGRRPSTERKD